MAPKKTANQLRDPSFSYDPTLTTDDCDHYFESEEWTELESSSIQSKSSSIEQSSMESISSTTQYPDPRVITDASGCFDRIQDALAELVDNSIQACFENDATNPTIHISLHLAGPNNYIVVYDNGGGMDVCALNDFAAFAKAKVDRSQARSRCDPVQISKFGVGAKSAGFYLGDRIRVASKRRESDKLHELVMDAKVMIEKYLLSPKDAYDFSRNSRSPGVVGKFAADNFPDESANPSLMEEILAHEAAEEQFTYVAIRLREGMLGRFQHYFSACADLADIYHTFLNPERFAPVGVLDAPNITAVGGGGGGGGGAGVIVRSKKCQAAVKLPPTTIFISKRQAQVVCIDRLQLGSTERPDDMPASVMQQVYENCHNTEMCDFTVVIPQSVKSSVGEQTVRCRLLYCPVKGIAESRPKILSLADAEPDGDNDEEDEDAFTGLDNVTFFVYWEGRLVPETIAKELPFFKKFKTPSKCIAAKVPVQWKRRVCGQLFLDSSYHAIAKNKLRLFAQPDFNHWLNEAIPSFADQRLPFIKWLQVCGRSDEEYRLEHPTGRDQQRRVEFYSRLVIGNLTLTAGKNVKVVAVDAKKKREIWVSVLHFEIDEKHRDEQDWVRANMVCSRQPSNAYAENEAPLIVSVYRIVRNETGSFCELTRDGLSKLRREVAHSIRLRVCHANMEPLERIIVGQAVNIAVHILDVDNNPIVHLPADRFRPLKAEIYMDNHSYVAKLVKKNRNERFVECKDGVLDELGTFEVFYLCEKIIFANTGDISLSVFAKDGAREIRQWKEVVQVVNKPVDSIAVMLTSAEYWSMPHRLEASLNSAFTVSLLNEGGKACNYVGDAVVEINSEDVVVKCNSHDNAYHGQLQLQQKGVIKVPPGVWRVEPKRSRQLTFSPTFSAQLTVSVHLETPGQAVLVAVQAINVTLLPGVVAGLQPMSHMAESYVQGEELPPIEVACVDAYGHRTSPLPTDTPIALTISNDALNQTFYQAQVTADGMARFPGICLKSSEDLYVPLSGLSVELSIRSTEGQLRATIPVNFQRAKQSRYVKLLRDGQPLDREIHEISGTVIHSLSYVLLAGEHDNIHEAIEINAQAELPALRKLLKYRPSWVDKGQKKDLNAQIPAIKVEQGSYDITFTVYLGTVELHCTHTVVGETAPLDRWELVRSSKFGNGIMSGDSDDLCGKLVGVVLYDEIGQIVSQGHPRLSVRRLREDDDDDSAGNTDSTSTAQGEGKKRGFSKVEQERGSLAGSSDSANSKKNPLLPSHAQPSLVSSEGGGGIGGGRRGRGVANDDVEAQTTGIRRRLENYEKDEAEETFILQPGPVLLTSKSAQPVPGFVLPPDSRICGKTGTRLQFRVYDLANPHVKCEFAEASVLPGLPRVIKFSCESAGLVEPSASHRIAVTQFQRLEGFSWHFEDSEGNSTDKVHAKLVTVRAVRVATGLASGSTEQQVIADSTRPGTFPRFIPIDFTQSSVGVPEEIQIIATYTPPGSPFARRLEVAKLFCEIEPVPIVERVSVEVFDSNGEARNRVSCEEREVTIVAACHYNRCAWPLTTTESFTLTITSGNAPTRTVNVSDLFKTPQFSEDGLSVVWGSLPGVYFPVGPMAVEVAFNDSSRSEVPKQFQTCRNTILIDVLPGEPARIAIDPTSTDLIRATVSVTDKSITNGRAMPTIQVFDRLGNITSLPAGISLRAKIAKSVKNGTPMTSVTKWKAADDQTDGNHCHLAGRMLRDRTGSKFDFSWNGQFTDGVCKLQIEFYAALGLAPTLPHLSFTQYVDVTADDKIPALMDSLRSVQRDFLIHYIRRDGLRQQLRSAEAVLREHVKSLQCEELFRSVKSGEQTLTPKFLDHAKKELSTRIKQYRDRTHPVPVIQRGVAAPPPPRGRRLVHIGFVQDENTARILSWAAGRKMGCYFVESDIEAQELHRLQLSAWSMESVMDTSNRALPALTGPGNPRYLVDCVELDPADDRIVRFDRGAALAAVFQANVLVDDMIAATNYRAHLRKLREQDRGVSIPTIFTRDGYVVEHAGFLDGKRTLKDAKFPFIFAPFSLSSFESYERDLALCEDQLQTSHRAFTEVAAQLERYEREDAAKVARLQQQQESFISQLQELDVTDIERIQDQSMISDCVACTGGGEGAADEGMTVEGAADEGMTVGGAADVNTTDEHDEERERPLKQRRRWNDSDYTESNRIADDVDQASERNEKTPVSMTTATDPGNDNDNERDIKTHVAQQSRHDEQNVDDRSPDIVSRQRNSCIVS